MKYTYCGKSKANLAIRCAWYPRRYVPFDSDDEAITLANNTESSL